MKSLSILLLLTAMGCDKSEGLADSSQRSIPKDLPGEEIPGDVLPNEPAVPTEASVPAEPKMPIAAKLLDQACVDPDLSKLAAGVSMTLCSGSIGVGTYVVPATPAMPDLTNLVAENIKAGVTINGVAGSYSGAPQPDLSNLTAGNIKSGVTINGVTGHYSGAPQPDLSNLIPGNIRKEVVINGVIGNYSGPAPNLCTTNGQTDCYVTGAFKGGDFANLSLCNVRQGVTIAGIVGRYPSSDCPLTGSSNVADLDGYTFLTKMKSSTPFEWFDSKGVRHEASGSDNIEEKNIKVGVNIFNVTGTVQQAFSLDAWNIRKGVTFGAGQGNLDLQCNGTTKLCDGSNWIYASAKSSCVSDNPDSCIYLDKFRNQLWAGSNGALMYHSEATSYCENYAPEGLPQAASGWRLPSASELQQATVEKILALPAGMFGVSIPLTSGIRQFWSLTKGGPNLDYKMKHVVNLEYNGETTYYNGSQAKFKVMCVRDM